MKSKCLRRRWTFLPVYFLFVAVMLITTPLHGQAQERLFFASDVHSDTDALCSLLRSSCVGSYETVCLVGDHGGPGGGGDPTTLDQYNDVKGIIDNAGLSTDCSGSPTDAVPKVLSEGNHEDYNNTDIVYSHGTGWVTLADNDYYDIYVINWSNYTDPVTNTELNDRLGAYTAGKVIFVMCHEPLHSTRDGHQTSGKAIFDTLQKWGKKLDIVFLWGHNHHGDYDADVDYIAVPGETINTGPEGGGHDYIYDELEDVELTFTYLNAGYVKEDNAASVISVDDSDIVIHRCAGGSETSVTVPRKKPSVVLLFDTSGSMNWDVNNDLTGDDNERKLTLAKKAAMPFVTMFSDYEDEAGIGIATFPRQSYDGCNAEEIRRVAPDMTDIEDDIEDLTASGATPMLEGLRVAEGMLPVQNRKAVLLLSDGYHNCPNTITAYDSEFDDIVGELGDISVYTIGFSRPGETDNVFLAELAGETGGEFYDTPNQFDIDPDTWEEDASGALDSIYSKLTAELFDLEMPVEPVDYIEKGDTDIHEVAIHRVDDKITFLLSWHTPGGKQLGLQVKSSDGEIVPANARGVTYRHGSTFKLFFVEGSFLKMPGKVGPDPWQMVVTGDGVGTGETETYQYCVITDSSLKMKASLDKRSYGTGDTVTLSAKLTLGGNPLPGMENVTVQVTAPEDGAGNWFAENRVSAKQLATVDTEREDETYPDIQRKAIYLLDTAKVPFPGQKGPVTLTLHDDGTNGDSAAGDGIYTNQYADTVKEGTYSFFFKAGGSVYEGDIFSREKLIQKYIVVNTSPDAIVLDMAFSGTVDAGNQYLLTVTPKDVYGNFLGPRFSKGIGIVLSKGAISGKLTDNLDGTYSQLITLPEGVSWEDVVATVEINGVTATLPLPEPVTGPGISWALWLLIILLIIAAVAIYIILR